tara:strand:- start:9080 stop:9949 length:870 start_codon:yes stop_codon:yes gene_type:complete
MKDLKIIKEHDDYWLKIQEKESHKESSYKQISLMKNTQQFVLMKEIIDGHFSSFKNLKIVEIGGGMGKLSLLLAQKGAKITIIDNSEKAKDLCNEMFVHYGLKPPEFIIANAFDLPPNLISKFDISISTGLIEHFKGQERHDIVKAHYDVIKSKGITLISVPHKYSFPYKIYKFFAEIYSTWEWGPEYPFTKNELLNFSKAAGFSKNEVFATDFSYNYFFQLRNTLYSKSIFLRKIANFVGIKKGIQLSTQSNQTKKVTDAILDKKETPDISSMDHYFGNILTLKGIKN